jgi:dipeptidase E
MVAMRLYLSSFRLGNQPRRLVDLAKADNRAAVVLNACDFLSDEERQTRVQQELAALQALGFRATELDLRHYFANRDRERELGALLATHGLVWVRGGNSFVLRRATHASGFDGVIRTLLERDAIVYGGFSAAIAVLTPSLHGVELVDDPYSIPVGYDPAVVWEGLGVLPYAVAPHYKSEHPKSAAMDAVVQYYVDNRVPFRVLRDGEVIVVNGGREEIVA